MHRCEGKRRMCRKGVCGVFKCGRKATTRVTTSVGFTEQHYVCNSVECFNHVAGGYPVTTTILNNPS